MPIKYNTGVIRKLIATVYTDDELKTLCFDDFREVYDDIDGIPSKQEKITRLIRHAEQYDLIEKLLGHIRGQNQPMYEEYRSRLTAPEWLTSAKADDSPRSVTVTAEPKPLGQGPPQEQMATPRGLRLNLEGIRREVDALSNCTDLVSRVEEGAMTIALLRTIQQQTTDACQSKQVKIVLPRLTGLTSHCKELDRQLGWVHSQLGRASQYFPSESSQLPKLIEGHISGLAAVQDSVRVVNRSLCDKCDEMAAMTDAAEEAVNQAECHRQLEGYLSKLDRQLERINEAIDAIHKDLYEGIKESVKELTRLVPTEKES